MKNALIIAVALFALFMLGAVFAGGAGYFLLRARAEKSEVQALQALNAQRAAQKQAMQAQQRANVAAIRGDFPLPPSKDGSVPERWEGYYFYATMPFENAVAQGVQRTRFWFQVKRSAAENFNAVCNEQSAMGDASIAGMFSRDTNSLSFDKTYTANQAMWHYDGKWVSAKQRIEGNWGGGQGGFVLYPRRLSDQEIAQFDDRNQQPGVTTFGMGDQIPGLPPNFILPPQVPQPGATELPPQAVPQVPPPPLEEIMPIAPALPPPATLTPRPRPKPQLPRGPVPAAPPQPTKPPRPPQADEF